MKSALGQCFCKKIQFEILFPTDFCSHCHCESCRRAHGAALVTWSAVPKAQFKFLAGANFLKKYNSSPAVSWNFCSECGTSLLYESTHSPEKIYFTVANIQGALDKQPDSHMSFEEHVSWFRFNDALPKFKEKSEMRLDQ